MSWFPSTFHWLSVRREERRLSVSFAATLFTVIAGHSMLETARDTLFLSALPPTRLPWAYLLIAALALFTARLNEHPRLQRRSVLSTTLFVSAAITVLFYQLLGEFAETAAFILYIWTGLVATTVVVQFWLLLGDLVNVAQAKRVFAVVAAGGVLGAAAGSGLARLLLVAFTPRDLLLWAAGCFAVAALVPFGGHFHAASGLPKEETKAAPSERILTDNYTRKIILVGLLATMVFTVNDYLFKYMVSSHVAMQDLGITFSSYYTLINSAALLVQLVIAPQLLSSLGVGRSLFVLPCLLLGFGAVFALLPGLFPALALKGVDVSLRHSLHRSATEILFLPLDTRLRERLRGLAASIGERGGQALASLAILVAIGLGLNAIGVVAGIGALTVGWLLTLLGLRRRYAERFRSRLEQGVLETRGRAPELDLESLEVLLRALSAENDEEVLAALDMFERYGKQSLLSPLILYHPSPRVVLRALEVLGDSRVPHVERMIARMAHHSDERIRATAVQLGADRDFPLERLLRLAEDPSKLVQVVALARVAASQVRDANVDIDHRLDTFYHSGLEARIELARVCAQLPVPRYGPLIDQLSRAEEAEVTLETARALRAKPRVEHLPALLNLLQVREAREAARHALIGLGPPALNHLANALASDETPQPIRLHLPRTISRFGSRRALVILMKHLDRDDRVGFKVLRAVGRLRADRPSLPIDKRVLLRAIHSALIRTCELVHYRIELDCFRPPLPSSRALEFLVRLLEELELEARERVFRLLHILEPRANFELIHDGLFNSDGTAKAASRELLEHVLPAKLKEPVLALASDAPARRRVEQLAATLKVGLHSDWVFERLLTDRHAVVRRLSAFHLKQHPPPATAGLTESASRRSALERRSVELQPPELNAPTPEPSRP